LIADDYRDGAEATGSPEAKSGCPDQSRTLLFLFDAAAEGGETFHRRYI
jgi:hypothetical protein